MFTTSSGSGNRVRLLRRSLSDWLAASAVADEVAASVVAADVPNVKQRLGIGTPLAAASPAEILELVIGGSLIELDNGWRLTAARIAGDEVLELVLNGVAANRDELLGYGFSEEIVYYKRRWFVVREFADDVLSRLLVQRKPIKDLTSGEEPQSA